MKKKFNYLKKLLKEVNEIREKEKYTDISENDYDEISFIANKKRTEFGLLCGLMRQFEAKELGVTEKNSIRQGTKFYYKIFKKEGKIVRIESFINGKIDVVFVAHYIKNRRFMFPFLDGGGFYPTYSYVSCFDGNEIKEEYMVENGQIVYECYSRIDKNNYGYDFINYIPNGTPQVLSMAKGRFVLKPELEYYQTEYSDWRK